MAFQKIKLVTLPVLKMTPGKERNVFFLGAMHLGKKIDDSKEPATVAHVLDMDTGEEGQLICSTVLVREIEAAYGNQQYVGRAFEVLYTRVAEKKYNMVSLAELAVPEDMAPTIAAIMKRVQGAADTGGVAPKKRA